MDFALLGPEYSEHGILDRRTDIYALGRLACEMLFHSPPPDLGRANGTLFDSSAAVARLRQLRPNCSAGLARVIVRAVDPNPFSRYQTAYEILEDIRALSADLSIEGERPSVLDADHELLQIEHFDGRLFETKEGEEKNLFARWILGLLWAALFSLLLAALYQLADPPELAKVFKLSAT